MKSAALLVSCFLSHLAYAVTPSVTLNDGVYVGQATRVPSATPIINKWIGIRYSEKVQRFAPPQARANSNAVVQLGTKQPPVCIQQYVYPKEKNAVVQLLFNNPAAEESEDCLFLNVFAPANAQAGSLTVLVWILPGAFQFGGGTQTIFDGSKWAAEQNVVIVAGNHRTNVFGFPGQEPDVPSESRNLGLQDLNLYLQWVQKNIAKFGGDPKKVTIFGESSGSVAVDYLTISQYKNTPFRAAIMESGTALISPASAFNWAALQPASVPGPPWASLARGLGCWGSSDAIFRCIKAAPVSKIRDILNQQSLGFPVVVVDNKTVYADNIQRREEGRIANVPVLIGSNADEGRLFLGIALAAYASTFDPGYAISTSPFGGLIPDPLKPQSAKQGFSTAAFGLINTPVFEGAERVLKDAAFNCPAQQTANASAYGGYKTWRYLYNGTFTNAVRDLPDLLAAHAAEVPVLWGNFDVLPSPPTTNELAVSKFLQTTWANFAKNPSAGPGWRQYGKTNGQQVVAELAGNNLPQFREFYPTEIDKNCATIGPLDRALAGIILT